MANIRGVHSSGGKPFGILEGPQRDSYNVGTRELKQGFYMGCPGSIQGPLWQSRGPYQLWTTREFNRWRVSMVLVGIQIRMSKLYPYPSHSKLRSGVKTCKLPNIILLSSTYFPLNGNKSEVSFADNYESNEDVNQGQRQNKVT